MLNVTTVGAILQYQNRYAFAVGPTPERDALAVVRLGGHVEPGESAMQCLARELSEEAGLTPAVVPPPATFLVRNGDQLVLAPLAWDGPATEPAPLLVLPRSQEPNAPVNLTYLARSATPPAPGSEVKAILLLRPDDVQAICAGGLTLDGYLSAGGEAVLRTPLDRSLPLRPFIQLRCLSLLLSQEDACHAALRR